MKFARSLLALLALATISACAAAPPVASPPAPVVERAAPVQPAAASEDLSGLPRGYAVYFDTNSAEIRASTMQVLWEAAQNASKLKPLTIRVQGFTDGSGSRAANQRLSERRAAAVASQLSKLGVAVVIESRGLGESKGRQHDARSRRVEITFEGAAAKVALPAPTLAPAPALAAATISGGQVVVADDGKLAVGHTAPFAAPPMASPSFVPLPAVASGRSLAGGTLPAATGPPATC